MRVACPTCSAAYDVPDSVLSSGVRRLRCARCAHEWSPQAADAVAVAAPATPRPPEPPSVEPPAALLPAAEPPPKPRRAAPPPEPPKPVPSPPAPPPAAAAPEPLVADAPLVPPAAPGNRAAQLVLVGAWVVSFAILAGAGSAGFIYRERVASVWPPSQRLYAALGLAAQTR